LPAVGSPSEPYSGMPEEKYSGIGSFVNLALPILMEPGLCHGALEADALMAEATCTDSASECVWASRGEILPAMAAPDDDVFFSLGRVAAHDTVGDDALAGGPGSGDTAMALCNRVTSKKAAGAA
jgi:hypothetical protein